MNPQIVKAARAFDLNSSHETIYDNPNALIEAGFPAAFILPLIRIFKSEDGYKYHLRGIFVDELIGVNHASLVYAIAQNLGVSSEVGSGFTGAGFAMRVVIDEIRRILSAIPQE